MAVVLYEQKDKIVHITMNRPDALNTLNQEMIRGLQKAWLRFRDDDRAWVAIITGNGRAFSAGADLKESMAGVATERRQIRNLLHPEAVADELGESRFTVDCAAPSPYEIWKPIIAAINGYALGAGLWVAQECDLRIAAEGAELGLPEPGLNMLPRWTGSFWYQLPPALALEMVLVGDRISAQRAYEMGFVNKVVPQEELMPTAKALAERICENGPIAGRKIKELFYRGRELNQRQAFALMESFNAEIARTEDSTSGESTRAFLEKRKPQWKGR